MRGYTLKAFAAVGILASPLPFGCGSGGGTRPLLGTTHGTITYKGKPVPRGTVSFTPMAGERGGASGVPAIGQIQSDGSYELTSYDTGDGAVLGQHFVTIKAQGETKKMHGMPRPAEAQKIARGNLIIPVVYSDPTRTPLRSTVEEGDNKIDIALKD